MSFFPIPDTASCRTPRVLQFRNPQQVIRRGRQIGGDLGSGFSDETGLSHSAHRLQPAENLFDPLSFALADLVALGAGRPSIEARCLAPVNTGDMRLHDIGKLPKHGEAKDAAKSDLSAHAVRGEEMLRDVPGLQKVLTFVLDHHERYDGKGGPNGLKGESIPIGARIVAVANAFDHLLFDGKDPKAPPDAAAIRQAFTDLTAEAGEAYDMAVVRALIVAYRHGLLLGPPPSTDGIPTAKPAPEEPQPNTSADESPDDSSESSKRAVAARDEGSSVTRRRKAKEPKK